MNNSIFRRLLTLMIVFAAVMSLSVIPSYAESGNSNTWYDPDKLEFI